MPPRRWTTSAAAGVTKGAFFHHFRQQRRPRRRRRRPFRGDGGQHFGTAPYRSLPRAKDRVIGYVRFRQAILDRAVAEFTCLLGTLVQEAYATHPVIRTACDKHMSDHTRMVQRDIEAAIAEEGLTPDWSAESLAYYTQAVMQGSFIFAKAKLGPAVAKANLDHLVNYSPIRPYQESLRRNPGGTSVSAQPQTTATERPITARSCSTDCSTRRATSCSRSGPIPAPIPTGSAPSPGR